MISCASFIIETNSFRSIASLIIQAWKWSLARQHEEGCTKDSLTEADRREKFSFALARTLDDLSVEDLQQLLEDESTSQRLQRIESALSEGRRYLAARSTLRDALP